MVFIEDYDINVARYLVQGVDVWLNNPRRPLEASGTSGMKVCVNGGINMSILDGWWVEGYTGDNGWAIGAGEEYTDLAYQDDIESRAIYDLLEQEIVPLFYNRSTDGLPRGWIAQMKRSMSTCCSVFNTSRMVQEYMEKCYVAAADRFGRLSEEALSRAKQLAQWRRRLQSVWGQVRVEHVETLGKEPMQVGAQMEVHARVNLGHLNPEDVEVQLFHGDPRQPWRDSQTQCGGNVAQRRSSRLDLALQGSHPVPFQRTVRLRRPRASQECGFGERFRAWPCHLGIERPVMHGKLRTASADLQFLIDICDCQFALFIRFNSCSLITAFWSLTSVAGLPHGGRSTSFSAGFRAAFAWATPARSIPWPRGCWLWPWAGRHGSSSMCRRWRRSITRFSRWARQAIRMTPTD